MVMAFGTSIFKNQIQTVVCVCVFWSVCCGGWVFVCVSKVCPVPAAEINCKLEALSLGIILHTWQSLLRQSERGEAGVRTRWAVQSWCSFCTALK